MEGLNVLRLRCLETRLEIKSPAEEVNGVDDAATDNGDEDETGTCDDVDDDEDAEDGEDSKSKPPSKISEEEVGDARAALEDELEPDFLFSASQDHQFETHFKPYNPTQQKSEQIEFQLLLNVKPVCSFKAAVAATTAVAERKLIHQI